MFVGAREASTGRILLGAYGLSDDVFETTSDVYNGHASNGVYWYNYQGRAFGFSAEQGINLSPGDISSSNSESRLSWLVGRKVGGYRAGTLQSSKSLVKIIYRLKVSGIATDPYHCDPWNIIPCEIQQNYDMNYIVKSGFELCYQAYYSDSTSQSDFKDCERSDRW